MLIPRLLAALLTLASCGPSIDDHIAQLDGGGDDQVRARQELMLAKEESVPPLLAALEDPRHAARRPEIVGVLVDLMTRLDDERIAPALKRRMLTDPDSRVRAKICSEVGLYGRPEFAPAFMEALEDTTDSVRRQALAALARLQSKLNEEERDALYESARQLQDADDWDTRLEARSLAVQRAEEWAGQAHNEQLKGRIAAADSLYRKALAFAPYSKRASLGWGRLFLENGQEDRGYQILRETGWLLDVPQLVDRPVIDGRLDEAFWQNAARISPLLAYSMRTGVAIESRHHTELFVARTDEALYFSARCEEAHPESLIVQGAERDHDEPSSQDLIQMFVDPTFERKVFRKLTTNTAGARNDGISEAPRWQNWDYSWNPEGEAAAHIGDDFWSMEYRLVFGQPGIPRPEKGDTWAVDLQRNYRESLEWSAWTLDVDGYGKTYGWFLFQ